MIEVLVAAAAAGSVWWVPDEESARDLVSALEEDWPELEAEVVVGARPAEAWGYTWDAAVVTGRSAEATRSAGADDARVAVLHARTWEIQTDSPEWRAWLPTPDLRPDPRPGPPAELALEAVRPLHPNRHWSLGVGLGTRTMTTVPEALSGVRIPAELVVKSAVFGLDATFDPDRWNVRNVTTLAETTPDPFSATFRMGLRTRDATWLSVGPAIQYRVAAPTLSRGGRILSTYERGLGAVQSEFGFGHDTGNFRFGMRSWLRLTAYMPVSAGLDLDVLVFAHERRRARDRDHRR